MALLVITMVKYLVILVTRWIKMLEPQFFEWMNPTYAIERAGDITSLVSGMSHQVWFIILNRCLTRVDYGYSGEFR